ncbi:MAG: hypothetical protein GY925_28140 [Actinomycetia bacterium]|nr:hypothetical protein [Actinomycetes bacterium]
MSKSPDVDGLRVATFGALASRPTATLPQGDAEPLFTITGGRVMVNLLIGVVTVAVENVTVNTRLRFKPDAAADTPTDLCAVTDLDNIGVGRYLSLDQAVADTLLLIEDSGEPGDLIPTHPGWLLGPGEIIFNCDASPTGSIQWDLFYIALDGGAVATANTAGGFAVSATSHYSSQDLT